MMRKFSRLPGERVGLVVLATLACSQPVTRPLGPTSTEAPPPPPIALPLDRIAIVGASVSAGFGGRPFGDAFEAAAPRSKVVSYANVTVFRDPIGSAREQIASAIAHGATTIVALDLMFWPVYGWRSDAGRGAAIASVLGELDGARTAGAWIVLGDVPHVITASELMLPKANVPDAATLARHNATIASWASERERVLLVPFAAWAEPLAFGGEVELSTGERVPARELVAPDGLHANELGVWVLLDRLDHYIEAQLPGTPRDALVFERPRS
jgi:hypothetical protein